MSTTDMTDDLIVKLGTMAASAAAGWVTQRLVGMIWRNVTGNPAPRDHKDEDLHLAQAVAFAAVSAGAAVLVSRVLNRGAVRLAESFNAQRHATALEA